MLQPRELINLEIKKLQAANRKIEIQNKITVLHTSVPAIGELSSMFREEIFHSSMLFIFMELFGYFCSVSKPN